VLSVLLASPQGMEEEADTMADASVEEELDLPMVQPRAAAVAAGGGPRHAKHVHISFCSS